MFTIHQLHEAFKKVKTGADFPQLVQNLKAIGVSHYDNFVTDGKTNYHGAENFVLTGEAKYPPMIVGETGSAEMLKHALSIHQQGQTDYPAFCRQAAEAGVEKWRTDMNEMTVTYFDKVGNKLVAEPIPLP